MLAAVAQSSRDFLKHLGPTEHDAFKKVLPLFGGEHNLGYQPFSTNHNKIQIEHDAFKSAARIRRGAQFRCSTSFKIS